MAEKTIPENVKSAFDTLNAAVDHRRATERRIKEIRSKQDELWARKQQLAKETLKQQIIDPSARAESFDIQAIDRELTEMAAFFDAADEARTELEAVVERARDELNARVNEWSAAEREKLAVRYRKAAEALLAVWQEVIDIAIVQRVDFPEPKIWNVDREPAFITLAQVSPSEIRSFGHQVRMVLVSADGLINQGMRRRADSARNSALKQGVAA